MTPEEFDALGLQQGDVIKVHWYDVFEDAVGDTTKIDLCLRHTYTLFWERRASHGIECLVTCNTIDANTSQQGGCCTPLALIPKIEVVKKRRRKRSGK